VSRRDAADRVTGVAFRAIEGNRSTTAAGTAILGAAAAAVSPDLARAIGAERNWRSGYVEHIHELVAAEVRAGAGPACAVPRAGLEAVSENLVFVRDGQDRPLADALVDPATELHTVEVAGRGERSGLVVAYRGRQLADDALRHQLETWLQAGTVEPSFVQAVNDVLDHPDWLDLSDLTVAVLGAGAEMGPLAALCNWGATVLPVDLPRPGLWEHVLRTVRQGSGRALVPVRGPVPDGASDHDIASIAGADLLTDAGAVAHWLRVAPGPLTVGNYVYADGADFVRVSVAVDLIATHLLQHRHDISLAVLVTPTDVYAVPSEVVSASRVRHDEAGTGRGLTRALTGGRLFAPNYPETVTTPEGVELGIADSLIFQQGPNYALAKRLQRWRVRQARDEGTVVSVHVAPATRTRSVTKNRILAAAYGAADRFDVEVFEPDTSNTLMAALLVRDLRDPKAAANPDIPLHHPLALFSEAAAHGGFWRNPYAPRSVLPLAAVLGLLPGRR